MESKEGESEETSTTEENATMEDIVEYALTSREITRVVAEKIGAYNVGINLIADTIANLPCYLYKREKDGEREKVEDKRNRLLNCENSDYSTSFNMKKNLVMDFIHYGNGYLDIQKDASMVVDVLMHIPYEDIILNPSMSANKRESKYTYSYWTMNNVSVDTVLNLARNPKYDELKGVGVLKEGKTILSNAIGFEEFTANTLENGFFAKAVIEKEGILAKPTRESLLKNVKTFFSGKKNAGKVMILDDGMKLKTVALSPADLELLQQKEFTIKDIARLLKLQPSMLGIATGGMNYTNEKDNQLVFLKNCIQPILTLLEQTFNKYLLKETEKQEGYFFEFSTAHMMKMSPADELKMYGQAVKDNLMPPSEARRKLNLQHRCEYDQPLLNLAYGIIQKDGTILSHKKTETTKGGDED